ncbi:uncharacterized protein LOC119679231, partial [Teleopsis dalmanni]|uniref:uncharacterized protein LOC119679231 n=1 Tax=Teleopsis dalmanni TaxID=139649 RepID=UPI0018CD1C0E
LQIFLTLSAAIIIAAQQYGYYPNQYYNVGPTFSSVSTTPYPLYGQNNIRIWPYVIGQYGNPTTNYPYNQYNPNTYTNPNDPNRWQNWYNSVYQNGLFK